MSEHWKTIPEHTNYAISSRGRIKHIKSGRIRKLSKNKAGYHFTTISNHNVYVHRTLCVVFKGLPPVDKPNALHWDDNKDNNTVDNIYWGTHKDNGRDMVRNGKGPKPIPYEEWHKRKL